MANGGVRAECTASGNSRASGVRGKNVLWPQRTSFTIPVRGSKPLAAGYEISGTVRVDIKQPFDRPATPGSYLAYVFTGATVTGPFPVQMND